MKKLLSILGTFSLITTGGASVVACNKNNVPVIDEDTENKDETKNENKENKEDEKDSKGFETLILAFNELDKSIDFIEGTLASEVKTKLLSLISSQLGTLAVDKGVIFDSNQFLLDQSNIKKDEKALEDKDLQTASQSPITLNVIFQYKGKDIKIKPFMLTILAQNPLIIKEILLTKYKLTINDGFKPEDLKKEIDANFIKEGLKSNVELYKRFVLSKVEAIILKKDGKELNNSNPISDNNFELKMSGKYGKEVFKDVIVTINVSKIIKVDINSAQNNISNDMRGRLKIDSTSSVTLTDITNIVNLNDSNLIASIQKTVTDKSIAISGNLKTTGIVFGHQTNNDKIQDNADVQKISADKIVWVQIEGINVLKGFVRVPVTVNKYVVPLDITSLRLNPSPLILKLEDASGPSPKEIKNLNTNETIINYIVEEIAKQSVTVTSKDFIISNNGDKISTWAQFQRVEFTMTANSNSKKIVGIAKFDGFVNFTL